MAGIMNHTARQFNLKCVANGSRVVVRLAPGFNVVDDDHWKAFARSGKVDPYVAGLKKNGDIEFGKAIDDMELERAPDTVAKSKSEPMAKLKAEANSALEQLGSVTEQLSNVTTELEETKAELEKLKTPQQ